MKNIYILILLFINLIHSECSDLGYDLCIQYSQFCEWNEATSECEDITDGDSNTNYGPYQFSSFNESNGLLASDSYLGSTVFYPIDSQPPYSSIVIVPGAFSSEQTLHQWGQYYASHGFIAMTIGINDYFNDDMSDLAYSLLDAIEVLKQENIRED